jgi:hypothetical protein
MISSHTDPGVLRAGDLAWPGSSIGIFGSSPCVPASPAAPTAREAIRRPAPGDGCGLSATAQVCRLFRAGNGPGRERIRCAPAAPRQVTAARPARLRFCGGPRPAIEELELAMNTPPIISEGATGPTVTWAQYLLVRWTLSYTQIDGIFRPVTKTAVEQFQAESHLAACERLPRTCSPDDSSPGGGIAGASLPASRGSEPGGAQSHRGLRRGQCRSAGRRPAICIVRSARWRV